MHQLCYLFPALGTTIFKYEKLARSCMQKQKRYYNCSYCYENVASKGDCTLKLLQEYAKYSQRQSCRRDYRFCTYAICLNTEALPSDSERKIIRLYICKSDLSGWLRRNILHNGISTTCFCFYLGHFACSCALY